MFVGLVLFLFGRLVGVGVGILPCFRLVVCFFYARFHWKDYETHFLKVDASSMETYGNTKT